MIGFRMQVVHHFQNQKIHPGSQEIVEFLDQNVCIFFLDVASQQVLLSLMQKKRTSLRH